MWRQLTTPLADYWGQRRCKTRLPIDKTSPWLLKAQDGRCAICGSAFLPDDDRPQNPRKWEQWLAGARNGLATHELRPGWVASIPRGRRCSSRPEDMPDRRLPLHGGQSLDPAPSVPSAGVRFTRHQRGFKQFTRPVFPSPAAARMERAATQASPEASAPRRPGADDARQGRGQAVEHGPGTTRSTSSHPLILQSAVHSFRATSRRTVPCESTPDLVRDCFASQQQCSMPVRSSCRAAPIRSTQQLGLMSWRSPPTGLLVPDRECREAAELTLEVSSFGARWLLGAAPTRRTPPGHHQHDVRGSPAADPRAAARANAANPRARRLSTPRRSTRRLEQHVPQLQHVERKCRARVGGLCRGPGRSAHRARWRTRRSRGRGRSRTARRCRPVRSRCGRRP